MDLKRLQYFLAIAKHSSINEASKVLRISQPSLSRQLRILEEEIGYPLCERSKRGVSLTQKGEYFYREISVHVHAIEGVLSKVKSRSFLRTVELKVAICPTLVDRICGPFEQKVAQELPNVSLKLTELHAGVSRDLLHDGELDGAMLYGPKSKLLNMEWGHLLAECSMQELFSEDYVLVGPADSHLADVSRPSIEEIVRLKLAIIHREGRFQQMREAIEQLREKSGGNLKYSESESPRILKNLVRHSGCYTFLPYSLVVDDVEAGEMRCWTLDEPKIERHVMFAVSAKSRNKELMETVSEIMKRTVVEAADARSWRY